MHILFIELNRIDFCIKKNISEPQIGIELYNNFIIGHVTEITCGMKFL